MVHLPTAYEGGQLVVSHGGRSKTFDFSAHSAYRVHYAAFYADCNHEVGSPFASGCSYPVGWAAYPRLTLRHWTGYDVPMKPAVPRHIPPLQVRPVTRGHHVALVYSLTCSGQRPEPADHSAAVAAVRAVVQRWEEERQADASTAPEKLVYLLELR